MSVPEIRYYSVNAEGNVIYGLTYDPVQNPSSNAGNIFVRIYTPRYGTLGPILSDANGYFQFVLSPPWANAEEVTLEATYPYPSNPSVPSDEWSTA